MQGKLGFVSIVIFVFSALSMWYFGYKYYWWMHYPSLGHTIGGPEVTTSDAHSWIYGIWVTAILALLSLNGIVKFLVDRRLHKRD